MISGWVYVASVYEARTELCRSNHPLLDDDLPKKAVMQPQQMKYFAVVHYHDHVVHVRVYTIFAHWRIFVTSRFIHPEPADDDVENSTEVRNRSAVLSANSMKNWRKLKL